jgi:hypothetical protein
MRNALDESCAAWLAAIGLTSEVVRIQVDGNSYWKEQWLYKGEPTDYKRQEGVGEWAKRHGVALD